jgi:hypothetical protein
MLTAMLPEAEVADAVSVPSPNAVHISVARKTTSFIVVCIHPERLMSRAFPALSTGIGPSGAAGSTRRTIGAKM